MPDWNPVRSQCMLSDMSSTGATPERSLSISTELVIETPENVLLTYRLAGPAVRLMAYCVDFLIRGAIIIAAIVVGAFVASAAGILIGPTAISISVGLYFVIFFIIDWAYFGLSESCFRGKTIGKHVFGLRVIQEQGYPITLWGAVLRNFVRAADSLSFYGVGFIAMLVAGKFRRLGDLVARTVVIEERRVSVPREPIILEKIEPLERTDLGGFVPAGQTLALIEDFLGRRHVLPYRRGHAMARVLAQALAKRLDYGGDSELVERYPMAFLARVYATFHQTREDEDLDESRSPAEIRRKSRRQAAAGAVT